MNQSQSSTRDQPATITARATHPYRNASIRASAGTGKTYLLVSRILRLLISGVEPSTLLAITFTRKAAAEMHQRLNQRLLIWLEASDEQLRDYLIDLGLDADTAVNNQTLHSARHLFEHLLRNDRQIRITTFHAFCQDILRRFPMEADVPPGFDLIETTGLLEERAWDAMWFNVTHKPDTRSARALEELLANCGSIDSCRQALFNFLHHRSDWWAFTSNSKSGQAVEWASKHLIAELEIDTNTDPAATFFSTTVTELFQCYRVLLDHHNTKGNQALSATITDLLSPNQLSPMDDTTRLQQIGQIFYTQIGSPRKIKASHARANAMTEQGQERFLSLHEQLKTAYDDAIELQRRQDSWRLSTSWYTAGEQLLQHYQQLKLEQRLLDFTDLEWHTCQLLKDSHYSQWIQYKLDQRINHILVDEFQDTNPTQWQLLLPLLEELVSNGRTDEHHWSHTVFFVGDEKQSIYKFRRADPRLFDTATAWLAEHAEVDTLPLATSWRSSPAIIDCVNQVFGQGELANRLTGFIAHQTHQCDLAGRVELLPLIPASHKTAINGTEHSAAFRNPLHQPRLLDSNEQHLEEGRLICRHLLDLRTEQPEIEYGEIMILVRHRTHIHDYEQALREAGIPFIGNGKKTLLDTLEIQDMVALLNTLTSPGNNLALAQTLRSPIFSCSDTDLNLLASTGQHKSQSGRSVDWMSTLQQLGNQASRDAGFTQSPLGRAAQLLPHWQLLARQLPVHDLLDRIYTEADIEARFIAAFPSHLGQRVQANLLRFVELALEIDSGRYPSLPSFLNHLQQLRQYSPDTITQNNLSSHTDSDKSAVRILTIHAAKGLEATVVYLIDCGYKRPQSRAWKGLIDWPSHSPAPLNFTLTSSKQSLDNWSRQRLEYDAREDLREDANLLYVALTRAQQYLFISGCEQSGDSMGWYQHIAAVFIDEKLAANTSQVLTISAPANPITQPVSEKNLPAPLECTIELDLSRPVAAQTKIASVSPSQPDISQAAILSPPAADDLSAQSHGILVHRLLELGTNQPQTDFKQLTQILKNEITQTITDDIFSACLNEVRALLNNSEINKFFNLDPEQQGLNEVPISYIDKGKIVHGIIDRLIIDHTTITLIDYKTGQSGNLEKMATYQQQLQLYGLGLKRIWPQKRLRALLLFTATATVEEVTIN